MHSELLNLWLFFWVMGKVALVTLIGPGMVLSAFCHIGAKETPRRSA